MEDACIICRNGGPLDVIADRPTTWVTAPLSAPLPGYACVVSKRHVVEPFELDEPELSAFWAESMSVAAALSELLRPSKMNYEIHGNTIPPISIFICTHGSSTTRSKAVRSTGEVPLLYGRRRTSRACKQS
jgi:diadenosine tetraphosphate (Ap4A) HIT family hydrolase